MRRRNGGRERDPNASVGEPTRDRGKSCAGGEHVIDQHHLSSSVGGGAKGVGSARTDRER